MALQAVSAALIRSDLLCTLDPFITLARWAQIYVSSEIISVIKICGGLSEGAGLISP